MHGAVGALKYQLLFNNLAQLIVLIFKFFKPFKEVDMKRIISFAPKKLLVFMALAMVTLGVSAAAGAWYPERPTYTIEKPADHVTFNSITNNPNYGDERTFFDAKPASNTSQGGFTDKVKVKDGEEILVRAYVHNNAASNLNGANFNGKGVAQNTKIRIYLPTAKASALRANAYVSADNASPKEVADTVDFYGDKAFTLEYMPGTAVAYNNANPKGMKLGDNIVGNGTALGYQKANGVFPGCFQYANIVTVKVKVKMLNPGYTIDKTVANPGDSKWSENVTTKPGATVSYQMHFKNTGNTTLKGVVIRDQLPKGMKIVSGSTVVYYGSDPTPKPAGNDAIVSNGGLMIGDYLPGGGAYIRFKATAPKVEDLKCGANKLKNIAEARVGSNATADDAYITVNKECDNTKPTYSCDALNVSMLGGRKIGATVQYTALNGAKFKNVTYNFGDGSTNLVTDKTTVEYTYAKDGTYTITAVPSFMVDGKLVTAKSDTCMKVVTFKGGTPENPPTDGGGTGTSEIPNTGAGSTIALFTGTVLVSAAAYRLWMIRKLQA